MHINSQRKLRHQVIKTHIECRLGLSANRRSKGVLNRTRLRTSPHMNVRRLRNISRSSNNIEGNHNLSANLFQSSSSSFSGSILRSQSNSRHFRKRHRSRSRRPSTQKQIPSNRNNQRRSQQKHRPITRRPGN